MASSSKKKLQAPLFLAAALLFLVCTRGLAARPAPGSGGHMSQHAVPTAVPEKRGSSSAPGMVMGHDEQEAAMRECEGGDDQEECLMRRTLVAHTDYIYTQGNHKSTTSVVVAGPVAGNCYGPLICPKEKKENGGIVHDP